MSGRHDAIVLGAGVAGLSAATRLAECGVQVLVLEARPSPGGRATSLSDPRTGERIDNGQHVLFGCYRETFRFLQRVGAEGSLQVAQDLAVDFILPDGRASRLVCPPLPSPLHLAAAVLDWDALPWRDRLSVLRMRGPLARARASQRRERQRARHHASGGDASRLGGRPSHAALAVDATGPAAASPDETVLQWLVRNGQGPRLIEWLWEPLALAALNQPAAVVAALPFTRVLALMFGDDRRDAALVLPTRPLDECYVAPAVAYLTARGGGVRANSVARLETHGAGCRVVTRDGVFEAPVVVSAVPWFELPRVCANLPALASVVDAAARTAASPIVTVNLWFDRAVLARPIVGLPGRTMQWAFERRMIVGDGATHVSLVSSGADEILRRSNDALIALAMEELVAAVPGAAHAPLRHALVVREPRATFSLAPGQPTRPATATDVSGFFLAGDWIETGLPATIEGAAMSGHWAADAALAHLALPPAASRAHADAAVQEDSRHH